MSICLSIPRESSYNLPPIAGIHLDFDGVYIGSDPTLHLWPPGPRDKAPGSIRSVQAGFGPGLDRGALRRGNAGRWEMLEFGPRWVPWRPGFSDHYLAASAFNRYGVGWSFGPAHNLHDEAYGKWEELCGSPPEPIQKWDIDYSLQLWRQLDSEWRAKFGQVLEPANPPVPIEPVTPIEPTPTKPTDPNPQPEPIEPKPQEPTTIPSPPTTPVPPSISVDLSSYIPELKQHITSTIDNLRKDLMRDIDTDIDSHVLHERQWWHDRINLLAGEWKSKRPQLASQLVSLLEDRKLGEEYKNDE